MSAKVKAMSTADKVLVPLGVTIAGGVTANQFPQSKKNTKRALKKVETEVNKNLVPLITSDAPGFNQKFAQEVAVLVSKMEDEEAMMFCRFVMADVLDEDIRKNKRTLQRHLDEVIDKRLAELKHATMQAVSKSGNEEALEFSKAIDTFSKITNPYLSGHYQFDESDFRRDPRTGRFSTKINVDTNHAREGLLNDKQAANLGIRSSDLNSNRYKGMSADQKAQWQQEYMKVVNFINLANQQGDHSFRARIMDKQGDMYWRDLNGRPRLNGDNADWNPREGETVYSVEAIPQGNELSLAQASFPLVSALGGGYKTAGAIHGLEGDNGTLKTFADSWTTPGRDEDFRNSNEPTYRRISAGSQLVMNMSPKESSLYRAARMGRAVGDYGPQAENVVGPSLRRTAYRYRGVEKTPDSDAVQAYNKVIEQAMAPEFDAARRRNYRAAMTRAVNDEKRKKVAEHNAKPENVKSGRLITMEGVKLDRQEEAQLIAGVQAKFRTNPGPRPTPTPEAKQAALKALSAHLQEVDEESGRPVRGSAKNLYNLQLASGHTPPSEGFLIDKNGKIVTQAVGYGDDHYLPFNLKKLAKLRGGEYIRTRSVGGPTSEDIYTGLMAGADRVTVISRSGYFTIQFAEDFHGKRRYNDKAHRMVRRYQQLLDTVQSEEIPRSQNISQPVRDKLVAEVNTEMGWSNDRKMKSQALKQKINDYKSELNDINDDAEFRQFAADFTAGTQDLPPERRDALLRSVRDDWQSENEFKFRLNGAGYRDALYSLEEQFPYYFHVGYEPRREQGRIETEKDQGYVEPSRIRPTDAQAGWYGHGVNSLKDSAGHNKGKFSASHADYQRGLYNKKNVEAHQPATSEDNAGTPGGSGGAGGASAGGDGRNRILEATGDRNLEVMEAADDAHDVDAYNDAALKLIKLISPQFKENNAKWMNKSDEEITDYLRTPEGRQAMESAYGQLESEFKNKGGAEPAKEFELAMAQVDQKMYTPANAHLWPAQPFKFPGNVFKKSADPAAMSHALQVIDSNARPGIKSGQFYSQLSDKQMKEEKDALIELKRDLPNVKQLDMSQIGTFFSRKNWRGINEITVAMQQPDPNAYIAQKLQYLHQARLLKSNQARQKKIGVSETPKVPASTPTSGGTLVPRADPARTGATEENPIYTGQPTGRGYTNSEQMRALRKAQRLLVKQVNDMTNAMEQFGGEADTDSRIQEQATALKLVNETIGDQKIITPGELAALQDQIKEWTGKDIFKEEPPQ